MMVLRLFEFETASSSTRANPSRRSLDRFLAFAMSKRKKSAKTLSLSEGPAGAVSDPARERYRHRHHHRRRVDRSWGWLGDAGSRHRDHAICRQQERSLYENYIGPLGVPLPNLTVPLHANDPAPVIIAAGQDLNAN